MKYCPGSAFGNEQAKFMESSFDSMIRAGRLGASSTISSVQTEGQKYFNWLRVYLEGLIDNGNIVRL